MSKLRKRPEQVRQEAKAAFDHEILMNRTDLGLRQHDLAVAMGLSDPTTSAIFKDTDKLSVPRIRTLVQLLNLNPVTVLRWLGYSDQDIKKIKEV